MRSRPRGADARRRHRPRRARQRRLRSACRASSPSRAIRPGAAWRRARRSREIWAEVCKQAGVRIEHEGLAIVARRPEAATALDAFARFRGRRRLLLLPARRRPCAVPALQGRHRRPVLEPGRDPRRGQDRDPEDRRLARGRPRRRLQMGDRRDRRRRTARSRPRAGRSPPAPAVVCAGDDFRTLFAEKLGGAGLTRAKSHMLRVRCEDGFELPGAVASDLAILRLPGFEELDGIDASARAARGRTARASQERGRDARVAVGRRVDRARSEPRDCRRRPTRSRPRRSTS